MARIALPESGPPGMAGLLAFRPTAGAALSGFMQHLLRGPGPIPPAWREAIGAHVSRRNDCETAAAPTPPRPARWAARSCAPP